MLPGSLLDACQQAALDPADFRFLALVKRPLLDAFGPQEPRSQKDIQVFTGGRLAHPEFPRDQHTADAVFDQVAVDLRGEVFARLFQPFQDLQPLVVRQSTQHQLTFHIDN